FELSWTQGGTTVAVALRIVSSPQTTTAAADSPQGQGLRGLKLPPAIADASAPVSTTEAAQPAASAPVAQSGAPVAQSGATVRAGGA
ncbi:hypothetical protein NK280_24735, partial [Salmonella enterica]|nr:hypothetical protein [Salmonella enterica]